MKFYQYDKKVTRVRELAPYDVKEIELSESEIAQIIAIVFELDSLTFEELAGMVKSGGNALYGPIDATITPPSLAQEVSFWDEVSKIWIDGVWLLAPDGVAIKGTFIARIESTGEYKGYHLSRAKWYTDRKGPPLQETEAEGEVKNAI